MSDAASKRLRTVTGHLSVAAPSMADVKSVAPLPTAGGGKEFKYTTGATGALTREQVCPANSTGGVGGALCADHITCCVVRCCVVVCGAARVLRYERFHSDKGMRVARLHRQI
jgi:hypothetical protein